MDVREVYYMLVPAAIYTQYCAATPRSQRSKCQQDSSPVVHPCCWCFGDASLLILFACRYACENVNKLLVGNKSDLEAKRAVTTEEAKVKVQPKTLSQISTLLRLLGCSSTVPNKSIKIVAVRA